MKYPRILTLIVEIADKRSLKDAKWIWTSLGTNEFINGLKVTGVGEGDYFEKLDALEDVEEHLGNYRDINTWYNKEREDKIKQHELTIAELTNKLKNYEKA